MRIGVTGRSGHLGEALVRELRAAGHVPVGLDLLPSAHTDVVASITDVDAVRDAVGGADAVLHTATLHKPHAGTHDLRGRRMFPTVDRVYVNDRARAELGWKPRYDFRRALELLREGKAPAQPAGRRRRRQGIPPRADRPLHD